MSKNGSDKNSTLGNTSQSAKSNTGKNKKIRITAGVRWCFTFHKYTEKDIELINGSYGSGIYKFIVFSEELGSHEETPHLQGYIEFKIKKRPKEDKLLKSIFPDHVHWEKSKGNKAQNMEYISKEGRNLYINGKKRRNIEYLKEDDFYLWESELMHILKSSPTDRQILWYWEPYGNSGKSTFTKYLCGKHEAVVLSSKAGDMKYALAKLQEEKSYTPDIIIIDIPRSVDIDYLSYTGIEEVKNGCFFSNKYESRQVLMPSPHVLIFANCLPDVDKMSRDRWHIHKIKRHELIKTKRTIPEQLEQIDETSEHGEEVFENVTEPNNKFILKF